ncbi:ABC transporter ATP-binding protein [Kribbella sp.]|uniref:ABC transporter ATP-binding protein n=1 Tax=Kribbella sp. TaxID=1871183 RepID=UPI002D337294|nr:ABC transporter ATP-binding protein [Kribbella sp.]HZX07455.1 ABC transporter ATP-binding protein [Kribbella sp.]
MRTGDRYLQHARVLWAAAPVWSTLALALTLAEATVRTGLMIAIGRFAGSLVEPERQTTWQRFWLVAALLVTGPILQAVLTVVTARCSVAYLRYTFDLVAEVGLQPHGIGHLETPDVAGRLRTVVTAVRDWSFVTGVDATWSIIGTRLAGLGAIAVLAPWRWWVPLVVAASFFLVSKVFTDWISLAFDQLLATAGDGRRRAGYLRGLLTRSDSAKEIRLFGLVDWLSDVYRMTWYDAMAPLWMARRRGLGPVLLACLVMAVMVGGALVLIGFDVAAGAVALGGAVTMVQAVLRLQSFGVLGDVSTALARNTSALRALTGLRQELGLPATTPVRPSSDPRPRSAGAAEVCLQQVSFAYPGRSDRAVDRLTITIPAGQSVALVGVNGAGKSTVVKLLCGLYAPDEGTVRVDGGDPALDEATRRRVAVIFQDFARYPLSLRDNVVLGAADHAATEQALIDAGGAALLGQLEQGWDTVLSPEYDGGTDLSGGQWQRVALARALAAVADGAAVLVLDEPTAALDVRTEAALFERFLEVTRGVTTVLVSHRLSSVRHADRILVLADSGIVEDGSHDELLALNGRYAELFALQARPFTEVR